MTVTADEALSPVLDCNPDDSSAMEEAKTWLREVLVEGPVPAKEVKCCANQDGIAPRTLDRAKHDLKVVAGREGFGSEGQWKWSLPDPPT